MPVKITETAAEAAILLDADTGNVLYEKNADTQKEIASITKIMTALVVLENADFAEEVEIRPEYTNVEGSSIYLKAGEILTGKRSTGIMNIHEVWKKERIP